MHCLGVGKRTTGFGLPWRRGLVVLYPPATEETGGMGREIESRQVTGW
jgi:hypothetical protein